MRIVRQARKRQTNKIKLSKPFVPQWNLWILISIWYTDSACRFGSSHSRGASVDWLELSSCLYERRVETSDSSGISSAALLSSVLAWDRRESSVVECSGIDSRFKSGCFNNLRSASISVSTLGCWSAVSNDDCWRAISWRETASKTP